MAGRQDRRFATMMVGVCLAVSAWPLTASAERRYEVWQVSGGVTVVHLLEDLLADAGVTVVAVTETATIADRTRLRGEEPHLLFAIRPESTLRFGVHQGQFHDGNMLGGRIVHEGELAILFGPPPGGDDSERESAVVKLEDFTVSYDPVPDPETGRVRTGDGFVLRRGGADTPVLFRLVGGMTAFMDSSRTTYYGAAQKTPVAYNLTNFMDPDPILWIGYADMIVSEELARRVGRPDLAGRIFGMLDVNAIASRTGREYGSSRGPGLLANGRSDARGRERSEVKRAIRR